MSVNKGIAPPNFDTEIGEIRATIGDVAYAPLTPEETGYGDYSLMSDKEIQVFLNLGESREHVLYLLYNSLATSAAGEAKMVKDFDMQVDLRGRAERYMQLAMSWKDAADKGANDIFESFDTLVEAPTPHPELSARPAHWL